ncbi:MAG: hypothetical protein M1812_005228 [Candelaria pacifica]|nr:MAG: hypothetical protein M1812_005228 [Candelaria pacifica]
MNRKQQRPYLEFGREIDSLAKSLSTLEAVIANADKQNRSPRRPWHTDLDRYGPSWDVLPDVVGDFKQTLEECDTLLKDHSKFKYSQGGFIENVMWWSSVEGDVNSLKERVRFHMMKLTFVAKPFEIQLLLEIKRELRQLRTDVQELKTILVDSLRHIESSSSTYLQSLEVPPELAKRFVDEMQTGRPASMQSQADIPLKDVFDALVYHFAKSTLLFIPRSELRQRDPDEPKYLNLVKCRWISQTIRQSVPFQLAGPDSLWADYLKELEDDIRGQFKRFDTGQLVPPPLDRISLLPDSCFSIWVVRETPMHPPALAEQLSLEEKILELDLPGSFGTRKSTLTVFRKSESKMRLVTTTKDERNLYFHAEEGTEVDMMAHRLVPTYGTSGDASSTTNNLMICSKEGQDLRWYSFKDADDVLHFQRALTGFRVFHQMSNVAWSIEGSSKPTKSGKGSLQLWHLKPFQAIGQEGERASGDRSSAASPQSPVPSAGLTINSKALSASSTLFSTSSVASTVNGPQGNGTALVRAELPRIIIFTQCEGMYVFLQFKLHDSISINPEKTKSPTTVVIDTKSKNIEFQRMSVKELFSWNLACFRLPTHPEMRKMVENSKGSRAASKILETIRKKYIVLTFATPAGQYILHTWAKELLTTCREGIILRGVLQT